MNKISASNFGAVAHFEMPLTRTLHIIGGKSGGHGKSTALLALAALLQGKGAVPGDAVRHGERRAELLLEFEGVGVERHISSKGTWDTTVTIDGKLVNGTVQQRLDALLTRFTFGGERILTAQPKDRAKLLIEACGADTSDLDADYKREYDRRTRLKQDYESLEGALNEMPIYADAPDAPLSKDDITRAIDNILEHNRFVTRHVDAVDKCEQLIEDTKEKIKCLQARLKEASAELEALTLGDPGPLKSHDDLKATLVEIDQQNEKYRTAQERKKLGEEFNAAKLAWETSDAEVKRIDKERKDRIAKSRLPKDTKVEEGEIFIKGVPLSRASGTEQKLMVAELACASAKPEFPLVCMDMGEQFSPEYLDTLRGIAEAHSVCFALTRVGTGSECDVIMQDGVSIPADEWAAKYLENAK